MTSRRFSSWMWSEALSMLERAERLQRHFFTHAEAAWEPPVDILESADGLRVAVALPGVRTEDISIGLDASGLTVSALRPFPCRDDDSRVHRLEIPYGRFQRHIGLPLADLELAGKSVANGVLTLAFTRKEGE